jgi:hypothetical protein
MVSDKVLLTSSYYSPIDKWYVEAWHQDKGKIGSIPFEVVEAFVKAVRGKESGEP